MTKRTFLLSNAVAGLALALSSMLPAHADNVAVDASGGNAGNLVNGALLFGGPEPNDLVLCVIPGRPLPPGGCPLVPTEEGIASARVGGPPIAGQPPKSPLNQFGLDFYTDGVPRLSITHRGLIGIGTQSPTYAVQVEQSGDVQIALVSRSTGGKTWTLQSSGAANSALTGTFQIIDRDQNVKRLAIDSQGLVSVKALQITGGSDLAEPFETATHLAAGSLVVIDDADPGRLLPSTHPYDRRVAGVVSGANGVRPGLSLEQLDAGEGHQQVALSGRVYALADTSNGPIHPGDLLTTSSQPAHAMRASNLKKAQGAIIGKAMGSLDVGEGLVLVLVTLQ